jgi:hypothetical protein
MVINVIVIKIASPPKITILREFTFRRERI